MRLEGDDGSLQDVIDGLKNVGQVMLDQLPEIAETIRSRIAENAIGGVDAWGRAWPSTKDGRRPLQNPGAHISVRVDDSVITIKLDGHYVWHHFGSGGLPKRGIIPEKGLPPLVGNAIRLGFIWDDDFILRSKQSGRRKR